MKFSNFFSQKKKVDFYDLLIKHSEKVYEAYKLLVEFFTNNNKELADKIYHLERDADDFRRILLDNLNRTLVTPFDREDIDSLSNNIDEIVDSAKITVEEFKIFKLNINEDLLLMANILQRGSLEIFESLQKLQNYPNIAKEHAVKAKQTENHMHHVYLKSLAKLFDNENNSPGYMLKMRELYRHLNRSADKCDDAANTILNIIIKTE